MTIVIALLVIPFIPDYPGTKLWWLKDEHQILAVSYEIDYTLLHNTDYCDRIGDCKTKMLVLWMTTLNQ